MPVLAWLSLPLGSGVIGTAREVLVLEDQVRILAPQLFRPERARTCVRMRRPRFTPKQLADAVAASRTAAETLRRLGLRPAGGNFGTLKKYTRRWRIDTSHFDPNAGKHAPGPRKPLDEILVEDSTYSRGALKRRLYDAGIKQPICELCGQDEIWRGRRMALILDHANGIATDNRLDNLRIVCPNCAATLDTHCGRNVSYIGERSCSHCGAAFRPRRSKQKYCSVRCAGRSEERRAALSRAYPERRKVLRPPYEQLIVEVRDLGYSAVGRKYGVSDNAIRKWIRFYERDRAAASEHLREAA
jgi:hypothetical protein